MAPGAGSALGEGDVVAGATLTSQLGEGGGVRLWNAQLADGRPAVVVILLLDDAEVRSRFVTGAEDMKQRAPSLPGVLPILAVDPELGAYVGDAQGYRTLADIQRIDWTQNEVLTFVQRLGKVLHEMHEQGVVHGCLRPECVLVTRESEPIVANAKAFDVGEMCRTDPGAVALFATYSPPEQRFGRSATFQTDIFSLGRLFHLALMADEPDEKDENLPRLDVLDKKPNGIRRMVRACVAGDLDKRYDLVRELVEDIDRYRKHEPVGLPHPAFDKAAALERREKARAEAVKEGRVVRGPEAIIVAEGPAERMSLTKRVILVTAGVLSLAITRLAWGEPLPMAAPEEVGMSSERLAQIGDMLRKGVDKGEIPGAVVLVARQGKIAYFEAVGMRDTTKNAPLEKDAIFRIYSMTKPFTSVAAMMLVEDGVITLAELEKQCSGHGPVPGCPIIEALSDGSEA